MSRRLGAAGILLCTFASIVTGCEWRGANSLPLPGTAGRGPGAFMIQAELPDVANIQRNSRVRVGDVMVGNVEKIELRGWHALVTMSLDGDVNLPANATATIGQTSLLGSLHIELAPPGNAPPEGRLHEGSFIPLSNAGAFPTTEQTLAATSLLLNGGGLGQAQDITTAFSTAWSGREVSARDFIDQAERFVGKLDDQKGDIVAAAESLDGLLRQFADQKPVLDEAMRTVPGALRILDDERDNLSEAFVEFGKLGALVNDATSRSKSALVQEFKSLGPVLASLANAGPSLTRSLSVLATYPWAKEQLQNWFRGDFANLTAIIDLTLSRLDSALFTGTRFEGNLTQLEMQWGRTVGQLPSPATNGSPLVIPYRLDQGP